MSDTDRAWFKKNPNANCRVRRPGDGEAAELARRMTHGTPYEIEMVDGSFPAPADHEWFVLVIKGAPDLFIRMLTLRDQKNPAKAVLEYSLYAVAVGDRLAIDQRG